MRLGRVRAALAAGLLVATASGCAGAAGGASPLTLTVFGASSLRSALEGVERAYEASHSAVDVLVSTDSSATLRTQIEHGAPADVFLAADTKNAQALADAGLTDGEVETYARNALAIIVPAEDPAAVETPADLARDGVRVIAAGPEVPITRYADEAIGNLAALPGYPPDFAAAYARNIVSREDNVATVVAKIRLGEGDAAFVYETDAVAASASGASAAGADPVISVALPDAAAVTATYAGVVVGASAHPAEARAFLQWLAGADGQAVLADYGFQPAT